MNKKALSLAICLAMAIPTASNALSLGDIESKSSLNQPFQGSINLFQTNPAEVKSLRVKVASPEVFNRVGIDRPAFLNNIQFRTTVQNGRPVILVSSSQPINEPFLNFLLEISWPNGQLLKEYTVLLDPPALLRPNTAIASNSAGIRAEPRVQGRINRAPQPTPQQVQAQRQRQAQFQRQAQQQRLAQQQQTQEQTSFQRQAQQVLQSQQARRVVAAPTNRNYRVRSGDTLSKVASKLGYNGVRQDQMMIALFKKNSRAFSRGNMNNLKAGAIMARPSLQEARSSTSRAARSQIIAQARAWKAKRVQQLASRGDTKTATNKTESARLEVLGKTNKSTANNSSSNGNAEAIVNLNQKLSLLNESLTTKQQENTDLKSRVSELESLLRNKNRLIALKSEQLAGLQAGLSGDQTQQTTETPTPETIGEGIQNQVATELASANGEIVRATPETSVVDNTVVPDPVIEPVVEPEVSQQEATNTFKPEEEAGLDIMGLISSPVGLAAGAGSLGLLALFGYMVRRRKNKVDEEFEDFSDLIDNGLNDQDFDAEVAETDDVVGDPVFDESEYVVHDEDIILQEAVVDENDDELEDLIQEVDVYIVYGLHDQAESEINRALNSYPKSAALYAKLLENFKAAGNAEAFEDATKAFIDLDADNKQNHWDEICEWGNDLLPDSKLFDKSTLAGIAATTGVAMVAGTAIAAVTDDTEALYEDISEDALSSDIENFDDFDDLGLDLDSDSTFNSEVTLDTSGIEVLSDNSPNVAELPEDFKIDLDEDFDSILDSADLDTDIEIVDNVTDGIETNFENSIEDTDFLFDDESLEDLLNVDESEEDDGLSLSGLATSGLAATGLAATGFMDGADADEISDINEAANLNLEIGGEDFDKIMPQNNAYKSVSEDINAQFDVETDDNLLADFDDNLSFLDLDDDTEVIGETQIETKIDLARAYIDMGDLDGARSTLEEVMEAGNDDQKRQAEELLHQNG